MPQILDRDEEHKRRKDRLAKQKRGPGTFVYDGAACDTEWIATPMLKGQNVALMDASGMPVVDGAGRQMFEKANSHVTDSTGRPVMGGRPKVVTHKIEVYKLRGVEFPAGKPVKVENDSLALKLRCMAHFTEVEEGAKVAAKEAKAEPADKAEPVAEIEVQEAKPKKMSKKHD
jgi:hypothetical protein